MGEISLNLAGVNLAAGLSQEDAELVEECVKVLNNNIGKHDTRRRYYDDKIRPKERGMKTPKEFKNGNFSTGWAAKIVNALSDRSILDGFTFAGETPDGFDYAMRANDIALSYSMAMPSMLIDGVGFWTVTRSEYLDYPTIAYYDACTSAGVYDWKHKTLRCCLVVNDFKRFGKSLKYVPSECILYTPTHNTVITRRTYSGKWEAVELPHPCGRVMAEPMVFQKTNSKPFGRSRISKAVMCYIDMMLCEMQNAAIQAEIFSIPMKYIVGAGESQYSALCENVHNAYKSEMLVMTPNDDGANPSIGMLQSADMTPHIAFMDKIARMIAAETSMPLSAFGVHGNGYTSSDALRASTDDLVVLANSVNAANAKTMVNVAKLAIAVMRNKPFAELDENESTVTAHFLDPSMPTDAANADSMIKVVSAVPSFAGTDVFWEKLGYDEDERRRIKAETAADRGLSIAASVFGAR